MTCSVNFCGLNCLNPLTLVVSFYKQRFFALVLIMFAFDFGVQNSLNGGATIVVVNVKICAILPPKRRNLTAYTCSIVLQTGEVCGSFAKCVFLNFGG